MFSDNGGPSQLDHCLQENANLRALYDGACARVRELEGERLTHGNIMGRIAVALFGDQNNRTDEECVAAVAKLGYRLYGAVERAERAEQRLRELGYDP